MPLPRLIAGCHHRRSLQLGAGSPQLHRLGKAGIHRGSSLRRATCARHLRHQAVHARLQRLQRLHLLLCRLVDEHVHVSYKLCLACADRERQPGEVSAGDALDVPVGDAPASSAASRESQASSAAAAAALALRAVRTRSLASSILNRSISRAAFFGADVSFRSRRRTRRSASMLASFFLFMSSSFCSRSSFSSMSCGRANGVPTKVRSGRRVSGRGRCGKVRPGDAAYLLLRRHLLVLRRRAAGRRCHGGRKGTGRAHSRSATAGDPRGVWRRRHSSLPTQARRLCVNESVGTSAQQQRGGSDCPQT